MNDAASPLFAPARWREVRAVLDRIDAMPATERMRELETIEASDKELARAVRALLMDKPIGPMLLAIKNLVPTESIPTQIGPFRPLQLLGIGGMGSVYLAERQGIDFTQRVALKLLSATGPNVVRLIARERSILAALTHPNITAFVDAGSENGQAWLAMEYVNGEPLLDYCKRLQLDSSARVRIFDQVCAAVAYAHSQLVVHRDLKPSNVLVTREGTVKLLDFGIATVLTADQDEQPATRVFTPEYAAPEQLRGERATTATDVYALGLMLYELIVGRRLPTVMREGGGADWSTAQLVHFANTAADLHQGDPMHSFDKGLAQLLSGDLGRIIGHALAFEPQQRYATVAQLRDDLSRWLDHRPLSIGRRSFSYVASRFARRHRAAISFAAAMVLMLIGTSIVALWQAHEARLMAARADQAKTFLATLFTEANPYEAKRSGKSAVDLLREAAQRIDSEFADAPEMQTELRSILADSLMRLDEPQLARELAQHNVEQMRQVFGLRAPQVGAALEALALMTEESGDIDNARTQFEEAYSLLRDASQTWAKNRIGAMTGLAKMANRRDDYEEAQRWSEAVLRERIAREGPQSQDIAMDLMNLSAVAAYQQHFEQSEELAEKAHDMIEHVLGPGHARSIYVDNALGAAQIDRGHYAAAVETFERAVATARRVLPPKARMLGANLTWLGKAQFYIGDDDAAAATFDEAISISISTEAKDPGDKGMAEFWLGRLQLRAHGSDAAQTLRTAQADLKADALHKAGMAPNALWAQAAYGAALAADGDIEEGERQARQARSALLASKFASDYRLAEIDLMLADVLERKGALDEVRAIRQEALTTYLRIYGAEHPLTKALAAKLN
jgi:eukaryotic-like serine/threonine-protein kinase